ncbi:MAG: hypothetical protein JW884_09710 [Deltaproteobacteria bacterium]|nr:hypothetical protein [Deltaproteobacteria bacterium]
MALVREFDPSVGEVLMDSNAIHRTFLNIVSNAIDAWFYDTGIDISHSGIVRTARADGNMIRFEVTDNGSGMSCVVRAKL